MSEWFVILIIGFVIFQCCKDIRVEWVTWRICRLVDLNNDQLSALGFVFYGKSERDELMFLFHERFIFKLRHSRIYIVERRYLEMHGTMDMNIKNIEKKYRKCLYTNIKKSLKDGSYLADPAIKEQLYVVIERSYKRYIKMRLIIYGGNQ